MWRTAVAGRCTAAKRVVFMIVLSLILMGVSLMPGGAAGDQVRIDLDQSFTVEETGQARMEVVFKFNPPQQYGLIKARYGNNLLVLFRDLISARSSMEIPRDTLKISADDVKSCITVSAVVLGYAVSKRNRWEIPLSKDEDVKYQNANVVLTQESSNPSYNTFLNISNKYTLPAKAQDVNVDKSRHVMTFTIPHTRATSGLVTADADLRFKAEIMSAVYKIYAYPEVDNGEYWVAKTVFKNSGKAPLYDLKFYYKLGDYTELESTDRYNVVMPGGSVVDLFYPNISSKVAELRTKTPVRLYVKYEYTDPSGKLVTEELQERVDILGINQFAWSKLPKEEMTNSWYDYFSNAPLAASFVTRMDEPVKHFGGLVSAAAGGVAANSDDKSARVWLKAAYDLQWYNNIVYQTPSGFLDVNQGSVQEIKFPRNVFRDKAGTCVDLAITYAALAEATGLHANIMMIPGHAFAVIELPSGDLLPVENTGLAGGRAKHASFEDAVAYGIKEFNEVFQKGLPYYWIDVSYWLSEGGIPNPELPPLPTTFLKECGIVGMGADPGTDTTTGPNTSGPNASIFRDDFSSSGSGWPVDRTKDEGTAYVDGEYEIRIFKKTLYSYSAPVKGTIPSSYLAQTDARVFSGSKGYYALLFNMKDWNSFYYLFVVDPAYRSYALWKIERGNLRSLLDWTVSSTINSSGRNTLAVIQDGNKAAVFINGKALTEWFTLSDVANPAKVGLGAGNFGGFLSVNIRFDNFTVIGNPQ